jgi:hypothetical protein
MRKVVTICGTIVAALVLAGVAAAAAPQGKLTGSVTFASAPLGIHALTVKTTIVDGETVNVAKKNDRSGDCDGDSGSIKVDYAGGGGEDATTLSSTGGDDDHGASATYNIICAHNAGDGSMMVDYFDTRIGRYVVFRVIDRPAGDTFLYQTETNATRALQWVNLGTNDSGHGATPLLSAPIQTGGFTITA